MEARRSTLGVAVLGNCVYAVCSVTSLDLLTQNLKSIPYEILKTIILFFFLFFLFFIEIDILCA